MEKGISVDFKKEIMKRVIETLLFIPAIIFVIQSIATIYLWIWNSDLLNDIWINVWESIFVTIIICFFILSTIEDKQKK